jgi:hypothetical protein
VSCVRIAADWIFFFPSVYALITDDSEMKPGWERSQVADGNEGREGKKHVVRIGREFKDVRVIPTSEASRNKEGLKVSTRVGESLMMSTGAAGYAVELGYEIVIPRRQTDLPVNHVKGKTREVRSIEKSEAVTCCHLSSACPPELAPIRARSEDSLGDVARCWSSS